MKKENLIYLDELFTEIQIKIRTYFDTAHIYNMPTSNFFVEKII